MDTGYFCFGGTMEEHQGVAETLLTDITMTLVRNPTWIQIEGGDVTRTSGAVIRFPRCFVMKAFFSF